MDLISNNLAQVEINGWIFLAKKPGAAAGVRRLLLLLHGYLGNEESMWLLAKTLPGTYIMLAPRAPLRMDSGQYSWHEIAPQWPDLEKYHQLADGLLSRVHLWSSENNLKFETIDVMGFSQGAVMAYALALLYPDLIGKVAALAGFLPQIWMHDLDSTNLSGRHFFISHGKKDDVVPIKKAYNTIDWLKQRGAQVAFCESNTGHKMSTACLEKMGKFFR